MSFGVHRHLWRFYRGTGPAMIWLAGLALAMVGPLIAGDAPAWPQWGGPGRDFVAPASRPAAWADDGPRELWSRALGDGHSAILFEEGRLYTLYRPPSDEPVAQPERALEARALEAVVSLDATNGETLWEHRYPSQAVDLPQYGDGPRATPLLAGDRLFTVGRTGTLLALDKSDGTLLWQHELWQPPFAGNRQGHGYSSSPIAYQDSIIVPIGGPEASIVAFDQNDGRVVWRLGGFANSHSSPRLLELAGRLQLLVFMREGMVAIDPDDGELLWDWPHTNQWGHNITMPSVVDDIVFFSSPHAGARGLRLTATDRGYNVEQVWSSRRIQFYHAATVQLGDWVYGSTGTASPAFLTAVNIRTGEVGWRQRGFARANCVDVGGRLVILDENGMLYLADATPTGLSVLASTQLLGRYAWTVPTIVGSTLYARDQRRIVAVDLS